MSGKLFDKYGAILQEDVDVLEPCLAIIAEACLKQRRFARVCEIGMHDGNTARGIENYFRDRGVTLTYWGIDPLTAAQNNLVESQYRYNVSKLALARATGVLETQYRTYLGR